MVSVQSVRPKLKTYELAGWLFYVAIVQMPLRYNAIPLNKQAQPFIYYKMYHTG